jgi:hypothetical protein
LGNNFIHQNQANSPNNLTIEENRWLSIGQYLSNFTKKMAHTRRTITMSAVVAIINHPQGGIIRTSHICAFDVSPILPISHQCKVSYLVGSPLLVENA